VEVRVLEPLDQIDDEVRHRKRGKLEEPWSIPVGAGLVLRSQADVEPVLNKTRIVGGVGAIVNRSYGKGKIGGRTTSSLSLIKKGRLSLATRTAKQTTEGRRRTAQGKGGKKMGEGVRRTGP